MSMARKLGIRFVDRAIAPDDLKARLQERDQRLARDHRSEAERWLGDPSPDRSALAQRRDTKPPVRFRG